MKILITGKNGQVGKALEKRLQHKAIFLLSRHELDLSKPATVSKTLQMYKPDLIINAAAFTAVDKAESDADEAYKVNADAVFELANYASKNQICLYHYSTDYVFDGEMNRPYIESDSPRPLNVYGASKLKGEQAIVASGCRYCIFRTSWVYALDGHNFIKTILKLIPHQEELKIVSDQIGAPTSARLIAEITQKALEKNLSSGIYHLTASGFTSWFHLAQYAVRYFYQDNMADKIMPISSANYAYTAKRPLNSRLNTAKLEQQLQVKLPQWQDEFNHIFENYRQELL